MRESFLSSGSQSNERLSD